MTRDEKTRLARHACVAGLVAGVVGLAYFVSTIPEPQWPALVSLPLAVASCRAMGELTEGHGARGDGDGRGGA